MPVLQAKMQRAVAAFTRAHGKTRLALVYPQTRGRDVPVAVVSDLPIYQPWKL